MSENASIEEYGDLNSSLKQKIARFFRDFGIVREYDPANLETAFDIIAEEWRKLEYDHKRTEEEDKKKLPVYREIAKYLRQDDILEDDRRTYTRDLYECVNVFGITCTSRDRFTKAQLDELGKYGIDSVDIRTQGIDVVIVDEVSNPLFSTCLFLFCMGRPSSSSAITGSFPRCMIFAICAAVILRGWTKTSSIKTSMTDIRISTRNVFSRLYMKKCPKIFV